jgi:hypothetical protein
LNQVPDTGSAVEGAWWPYAFTSASVENQASTTSSIRNSAYCSRTETSM